MVSFLTDTATTGHPKFLFCGAPCTSPSGFETMTPNGYIESTATGAAWCKASATTYYPAVTSSVAGAVHSAVCQNSPVNCLSSAKWTIMTNNSSGAFLPTAHGPRPTVIGTGTHGNLTGSPALNFAVADWSLSSVRNLGFGSVTAAFVGPGDWLYATSGGD